MKRQNGIAYREEGPADGPAALLLHGYPETSYMWRHLMGALAESGWRSIAPDLLGFGDSDLDPPATWERQVEALEGFRRALGLERVALAVHDWGGLIGLRWACDHPDAVEALVISSTGFFADGKWHGLAQALRTEGLGERQLREITRERLSELLRATGLPPDEAAVDEYWKNFHDDDRRRSALDLYRSGDFEKLRPYEGKLAALGVPALLLWGANDDFAPVSGAYRFERELPDADLAVIPQAGHFVWEEAPERCAEAVTAFLAARIGAWSASSS